VRYVCSEAKKTGLMTAKAQFSAHSFSIAPMMDWSDKAKKSMAYMAPWARRVQ
jgi:hypothetical protein